MVRPRAAALLLGLMLTAFASPATAGELAAAQRLLATGRYAEAAEQFAELAQAADAPVAATLGRFHTLAAQGKYDAANAALDAGVKKHPQAAALPAAAAELAFARGDYKAAQASVDRALKRDPKNLAAHWVQAELHRTAGKLDAADQAYEWFVDYYNAADEIADPRDFYYIGLGAAQFARWNRLSDQFGFLVNELYPAALANDPEFWPAHLESGRLFFEKYNQTETTKSLQEALAINGNAPEIHAALARLKIQNFDLDGAQQAVRQALAVNPKCLEARLMQADIHLANFEPDLAAEVLEKARPLNPVSEELLGRLAASYGMLDGLQQLGPETRLGKLEAEATARNPHCGEFYYALADALDKGRKFPTAAHFYAKAVAALPQLTAARGQQALMYMRLGDEAKAKPILEESFEIDPFNVRVSNTLKVLEVLNGYETLETEHFLIRFDPKKDKLLARYAARRLEEIYPEVCRRMGFSPPDKSLFEIFNRAKNTDGHGWFSARMVGLPQVHTIGACAGKMVALTSPSSMEQRFNWARVLKHEFVHVVNLQQTNFNVPHWYTEALAVLLEDSPRPASWNKMLARRVPANEVFDLDTINRGFIRPQSSEDWQMAYCQAELYAEYLVATYGADALGKMLNGYRDNLNTRTTLRRSFDVSQEDFEKGYRAHLDAIVKDLQDGAPQAKETKFSELLKAQQADPDNVELAAELAAAYLQRKSYAEAGKLADHALKLAPKHQQAVYVKARLLLLIGENSLALEKLEAALDRERPQLDLLNLLAGLKYKAGQYKAAAELYALGRKQQPFEPAWLKSLALVHLKSGDKPRLKEVLVELAEADGDDLAIRKKLAQMALRDQEFAAAARWANQCLDIDVQDGSAHQMLAEALAGRQKFAAAIEEFLVAQELLPKSTEVALGLAAAYHAAGRVDDARTCLKNLLESVPDHPAAKELWEKWNP